MATSTKPWHNNFKSVGSGSSHNSFQDIFNGSQKAFYDFDSVGSGSSHSAFDQSGYQMVMVQPQQQVDFEETMLIGDELMLSIILDFTEEQELEDDVLPATPHDFDDGEITGDDIDFVLTVTCDEPLDMVDECPVHLTFDVFDEGIEIMDEVEPPQFIVLPDESMELGDEVFLDLTATFEESQPLEDMAEAAFTMDIEDQMALGDDVYYRLDYTTESSMKLSILADNITESSMEVQITQFNPPPGNILTHPSNPWEPIVVINGVTYAGVAPPGADTIISINRAAGVGVACSKGVLSFSASFNFLGGQFQIESLQSLGNLGDSLQVCGYPGVITEEGPSVTDREVFITRGIFGTREFSRELVLVGQAADPQIGSVMQNLLLQSVSIRQWTTVSAAAKAIANYSGIDLSWLAQDFTLLDMVAESGLSVGQALQSLASRVGALLCWTGTTDSYVVIPPDRPYGGWVSWPDCKMISSLITYDILDEKRDYVILPVATGINSNIFKMPNINKAPKPPVIETLYSTRAKIPEGQPADYVNLNPDFDGSLSTNGRIQIYVNPDKVGPPFTTDNHSTWFAAGLQIAEETGTGVKKLIVPASVFPSGINDNEFGMTVGYVRKTDLIEEAALTAFQERLEKKKVLLEAEMSKLRAIRTVGCQVSGQFFGSTPLPGQRVTVSKGHASFSGTIESVNVAGSANSITTLSISASNFRRVEVLSARQYVDSFWANGAGFIGGT